MRQVLMLLLLAFGVSFHAWAAGDLPDAAVVNVQVTRLTKAAKQGDATAMHNLAVLIRWGVVPGQTMADAFNWYRQAAEAGFAASQNNLGDMYESGDGGRQSYGDAIHWYTRAAMQGEPTAYLSLGECYAKGHGVGRDLVQAYQWLLLALKHFRDSPSNRVSAEKTLAEIQASMTPEQIAEGLRLATRFEPQRQTPLTMGDPPVRAKGN